MLVFAFTDGNMITVGPKRILSTEVLLQPGFHRQKSLDFYFLPKELYGTRRVPYFPTRYRAHRLYSATNRL